MNSQKEYYTIEDFENLILKNPNCKKYNKIIDIAPVNKNDWFVNYDSVEEWTDGYINGEYFLYVIENPETHERDELFLKCEHIPNIPDKIFQSNVWDNFDLKINEMIDKNIKFIAGLEKRK